MKVFYSTNMCASHERSWVEIKNSIPNFKKVNNPKRADVILAYLCAMSTEELNESRSKLKEFSAIKIANPRIKLIAGGCAVEIMDLQNEFPAIDATFTKLSMIEDVLKELGISERSSKPAVETYAGGTAAIPIATGCLRHCAFCKTAYLDMTLHSIPEDQIFTEIEEAIRHQGARIINITGENTSEWGTDLFGEPKLLYLLRKILQEFPEIKIMDVCGIALDEMTPKMLKFLTRTPQIGLVQAEAQSFIPEVRKAMNLSKSATEAKSIIEELSSRKAIISNVMVGHPGETPKAFREQLEYIQRKRLYMLDPDMFISTPGTASSKMEQIPQSEKEQRLMDMSKVMLGLRLQRANELKKIGDSGKTIPAYVTAINPHGSLLMLEGEPILVRTKKIIPVGTNVQCRIKGLGPIASLADNMIRMEGDVVS